MIQSSLTDAAWRDCDASIQYINSLELRSKDDADATLRSLKAELKDINLQLLINASESKEQVDKIEYEQWRINALKAARAKNKQIEYLRAYRSKLDDSESSAIHKICLRLSDFIVNLPSGVQVPSEVMRDLIAVQNFVNRSHKRRDK